MLFYDDACGGAYISTESDFPYRPSALFVMDGLIEACVELRSRLDAPEVIGILAPYTKDTGEYVKTAEGSDGSSRHEDAKFSELAETAIDRVNGRVGARG